MHVIDSAYIAANIGRNSYPPMLIEIFIFRGNKGLFDKGKLFIDDGLELTLLVKLALGPTGSVRNVPRKHHHDTPEYAGAVNPCFLP